MPSEKSEAPLTIDSVTARNTTFQEIRALIHPLEDVLADNDRSPVPSVKGSV